MRILNLVLVLCGIVLFPFNESHAQPEVLFSYEKWEQPYSEPPTLVENGTVPADPDFGAAVFDHGMSYAGERHTHRVWYLIRPYSLFPDASYTASRSRAGSVAASSVEGTCANAAVSFSSSSTPPAIPCDQFPPNTYDSFTTTFAKSYGGGGNSQSFSWSESYSGTTSGSPTILNGTPYYSAGSFKRSWVIDAGTRVSAGDPPPGEPKRSVSATVTMGLFVGTRPKRDNEPGACKGPARPLQCGAGPCQGNICFDTANLVLSCEDPVKTRGYPLTNNIHVNSRAVVFTRPMANASFTYDIHIRSEQIYDESGVGTLRRMLVDGDGRRYDYGLSSGAIVPEAGAYAVLTATGSGHTLTEAGPPESIAEAGNYSYEFNALGQLSSITDPAGNVQTLSYSSGNLQRVDDVSSGKFIEFTWSGGFITEVNENGGGAITTISYAGGRLTQLTTSNPATGTSHTANFGYTSGGLTSFTRNGDPSTTLTFEYAPAPSRDPTKGVYLPNVLYADGRKSQILWDIQKYGSTGTITTELNYQTGATSYSFPKVVKGDVSAVVSAQHEGAGDKTRQYFGYDASRNLSSYSVGDESFTMTYSPKGKVTSITDAAGNYRNYTYTGVNLTGASDNLGTLYTVAYSAPGLPNLPSSLTDAQGNTWSYAYNQYGQILSITPPTGSPQGTTTYTYEESASSPYYGWLKEVLRGQGDKETFNSYSALGDVTSSSTYIDPALPGSAQTTLYSYDASRRMTQTTHPDGRAKVYSYAGDRLQFEDDEALTRTNYTWCAGCRALQSVSKPLGFALTWDRNGDFAIEEFSDARAKRTTYEYGKAGELKRTLYPDGSSEQLLYLSKGRVSTKTNARSQNEVYAYNTAGRLTGVTFPTTSDPAMSYTYRADGSLLTAQSASGTVSYEYWSNRQLKAEVYNYSSQGLLALQRVEYEYYSDNLLKKVTWKNGSTVVGTWEYTYDLSGRMKTVKSFNQTNTFNYDGEGKITSQINHNGTRIETVWNDQRGWPLSITHKLGSTPFASYAVEYDSLANTVGNLTKTTELTGAVMTYGYDALYRLTSEARTNNNIYSTTYQYDTAGNLTQVNGAAFASYDDANKISSLTGGTISHDLDGNVTSLTMTGVPASTFTWNTQSKLRTHVAGGSTTTYTYNHRGLRAIQQQGTVKRYYVFAGDKLLGEVQGGYPQVAYTWGPDGLVSERLFGVIQIALETVVGGETIEAPLSQVEDETNQSGYAVAAMAPPDVMPIPVGNVTLWYHYGPQTETRYLTDEGGAVTDTYLYDAYGKTIATTGTFYNPHRYGGKYGYHSNLNAAGLILAGQRWYSPHLRRWVSRDPIGYEGGDNQYIYADVAPTRKVDFSGGTPSEIASDIGWGIADLTVGIGDGVLFGFGPDLREKIYGEEDVVGLGLGYTIGMPVGEAVGFFACGGLAGRGLAAASELRWFRWLNQNRYLRFGYGRMRHGRGPRIAVGPHRPNLSPLRQKLRHIDLRIRPLDP